MMKLNQLSFLLEELESAPFTLRIDQLDAKMSDDHKKLSFGKLYIVIKKEINPTLGVIEFTLLGEAPKVYYDDNKMGIINIFKPN